jgi:hypothetical protein
VAVGIVEERCVDDPCREVSTMGQSEMTVETSRPNPDMQSLDRLVGTWEVSGEATGHVTYEWTEGRFFLMQTVELDQFGHRVKGIEMIGHVQAFGEEPSADIRSRFYSYLDGATLDYTYEVEGDTLTIWGGEKGSPAYYKGEFRDGGDTLAGAWVYPGGGGYSAVSKRVHR